MGRRRLFTSIGVAALIAASLLTASLFPGADEKVHVEGLYRLGACTQGLDDLSAVMVDMAITKDLPPENLEIRSKTTLFGRRRLFAWVSVAGLAGRMLPVSYDSVSGELALDRTVSFSSWGWRSFFAGGGPPGRLRVRLQAKSIGEDTMSVRLFDARWEHSRDDVERHDYGIAIKGQWQSQRRFAELRVEHAYVMHGAHAPSANDHRLLLAMASQSGFPGACLKRVDEATRSPRGWQQLYPGPVSTDA